ncbi:hypothetical protein Tco_0931917 [Tanacetum coccineum]
MSTQQDIYAADFETHPPMLNKENYVPWSSRLLRYAKSRPNGKLIYNSIMNGPYVRRMILEPGDTDREVPVNETFHERTDDELTKKELKQEIWLRVQQMMKGSDIGIQEKKAKLFNEWERFTSTDGELIESYYHRFSKLMNDFKRNKHFLEKIASNLKFLNNLQPEWSRHVTIVHQTNDLHTADYTQLYNLLKYNQKEVNDLRAERLAKTHDPLALMANSNNPYNYPVYHQDQPSPVTYMKQPQPNNNYNPQPSFKQNYMQQPMPNPKDITDPTTAMNMALVLMAKAFKLNYSTPTNNNQRISSNPRNRHIAQPVQNVRNQVVQNAVQNPGIQNVGNQNGLIVVLGIANQNLNLNGNGYVVAVRAEGNAIRNNGNPIRWYNCRGLGYLARNCTVRPRRRDAAYLQTQLLIAQKEEAGIQLQAKEFDLMAAAMDLDEIAEVNANCILMANLQQASTSGTQTDKAPVYDSDGSPEVHDYDNCYNNEIFNIAEQSGGTVEQHPATVEETHTSNLHTELERTKERFENYIIKKENEYAKLWNDWYKKCEECKYNKILYDKAYSDMQQKIERLQAQLGDLKRKSKDAPCVSDTLDPLSQKLKNENVELEIQVLNYVKENAHLKITYKNLFDSLKVTRAQTKTIIDSLQDKLHDTIYENAKLRAQLIDKVFEQKDTIKGTSGLPKIDESHALSKLVTSNLVPTPQESKVVKNENVIASGMFRIHLFKTFREDKFVPINKVRASVRTNLITVSQPHVISKKDVNSDSNGLSSTGVDITTKTRRSQPRSNTKNDRNDKSKVVCAMCKQCLITANHDVRVLNYVNGMNSRAKKQKANVSNTKNQKKQKPKIKKPKKVGSSQRLASPKPSKPRSCLRWSPTGRFFYLKGKIIATSESKCQSDRSEGHLNLFMVRRLGMFKAYDRESEASHKFCLEVLGNHPLWK